MAAKPTTLPAWNTSGANRSTPTSGQQASGYTNGQRPASGTVNWLFHWLTKWAEYVRDGAFSGPHTFDDTVDVDGLITGAAGLSTTTIEASDVITADAGIVGGANQDVELSGTGRFKREGWSMALTPAVGIASNANVSYDTTNHYLRSTGAGTFYFAVPIRDNITITEIETECYGTGSCLIETTAFKLDAAGQYFAATASSSPIGVYATHKITGANIAVNWPSGGTFWGFSTLSFMLSFSATGGRISRIVIRGLES